MLLINSGGPDAVTMVTADFERAPAKSPILNLNIQTAHRNSGGQRLADLGPRMSNALRCARLQTSCGLAVAIPNLSRASQVPRIFALAPMKYTRNLK